VRRIDLHQARVTIVTLNVLFDTYLSEKIHTAKRIPAILQHLKNMKADLIGSVLSAA
jgi:hypothetical protein